MNNPLVSVIIPTYNVEKYIKICLDSILNQTYKNIEIIIIDDGSKDKTKEIIQSYDDDRIQLIENKENLGISKTRNKGIQHSNGKFICTMDSDDYAYPERIEKQVKKFLQEPDIGIVGGVIEVCDEELNILNQRSYPLDDASLKSKIFTQNPFAHPATMFTKESLEKVGGYNPDLAVAVDYDIYFRVGRYYKFANLQDTVLKLRTNSNSITQRKGRRQELNSLYIRAKAVLEWGYEMKISDKLFFVAQLTALYLIPFKLKFWLYNFLRKK